MRKIFGTSILILFLCQVLPGQSWNFAPPYTSARVSHMYAENDSIIFLNLKNVFGNACDNWSLYALDRNGEELWEEFGGDVFCIDSSYIYTLRYIEMGDVVGSQQYIIYKLSRVGNVLQSMSFPAEQYELDIDYLIYPPHAISVSKEGLIAVASKEDLVILDTNGSEIARNLKDTTRNIRNINFKDSSNLVIVTDNKILVSDKELNYLDSTLLVISIDETVFEEDTLFVRSDSVIYKFDQYWQITDSIALPADMDVNYFSPKGVNILFGGKIDNKYRVVKQSRSGEKIIEQYDLFLKGIINPREITCVDSIILIAGVNQYGQGGLISFDMKSNSEPDFPDVGIVNINIQNIEIWYEVQNETRIPVGYRFDMDVSLENKGTAVINSLYFFYHPPAGWMDCINTFDYKIIDDLNLEPGSEKSVHITDFSHYGLDGSLHFKVLSPDYKFDKGLADNSYSLTADIDYVNFHDASSEISVDPNPATEALTITFNSVSERTIQLLSTNGKCVTLLETNEENVSIPLMRIGSGIYLLVITAEDRIYTEMITIK